MPESLNELLAGGNVANNMSEAQEPQYQDECELHGITIKPLRTIDELTHVWLSLFLDRNIAEDGWKLKPVGTGQMSSTIQVTFHEVDKPKLETLVVKFASSDEVTREMGLKFNHYRREAAMYRRFAETLSAGLPKCYGAVVDKDAWFTIVLEDLGALDAYCTGQLEGTDYEHARTALRTLAHLQAPIVGNPDLDNNKWLNPPPALNQKLYNECLPIFLRRFPPDDPEQEKLIRWLGQDSNLDAWHATRKGPFAIFHGDFRLDNILFLQKGDSRGAVAVDWGDSTWASAMRDAAYFLGNGLKIEDRRNWEKDLVREYLDELNRNSKYVKISWDDAWEEYRRQSIYGLAQHIPAAGMLPDTERGKIMFRTLVTRQAQHAVDMDASSLVDSKSIKPNMTSKIPHLVDEGVHVPPKDSGPLWNESWYFDCTNGDLGMYARIGRLPNQDCCSFVAGIFQRDQKPILFVNMQAPLPSSDDPLIQQFSTNRFSVESKCLEPLKKFAFKLKGTGSLFEDPSAPLRGDGNGTDVENIDIDLVWETVGLPYKQATRYEIPCQTQGTIKIGDKTVTVKTHGERNHSWGVRNWWVTDWVWSGLHFEDGSHMFTIALVGSGGGNGFMQKDEQLTEVTKVVSEYGFKDNGLPQDKLILHVEPGDITVECEAIAEAGLRLLDPEGREAHLPRVMCSAVRKNDGIKGTGWLDFNRVVKREPPT